MKFVSLFAGIGGIDLGLERAGHTCVGQVEIDDYATRVLAKHWPNTPRLRDVRDFQGHEFGEFDLLTGGYPCQPFSYAGARGGENDPRHLWPEVHRIIRNVRPSYVLLENVPGHLSMGFGQVLADLAESGYDAQWDCIPAAAIGAPHLRDRVFIFAECASQMADGDNFGCVHGQVTEYAAGGRVNAQRDTSTSGSTLADAKGSGLQRGINRECQGHRASLEANGAQNLAEVANRNPSVPIGGKLNPTWVEWLMGFPIGWTSLEDSETP
jgi:DNA (cytosine-5)-methyltransferase 1